MTGRERLEGEGGILRGGRDWRVREGLRVMEGLEVEGEVEG